MNYWEQMQNKIFQVRPKIGFRREPKMTLEIERKFLVMADFKSDAAGKFDIKQGYLSIDPERSVRIRTASNKGFITVKGPSDESGMSRFEWEMEIPLAEAQSLFELCISHVIEKTRYIVEYDDHLFEVDEFHGANKGLFIAEVELTNADEELNLPAWIGEEVTNDNRYYNSYLTNHPFSSWQ